MRQSQGSKHCSTSLFCKLSGLCSQRGDFLTDSSDSLVANTTSPCWDQFQVTFHNDNLDWLISNCAAGDYPTFPCPPPLLRQVLTINHLRYQTYIENKLPSVKAGKVISDIQAFDPRNWAHTKPEIYRDIWETVAKIFQTSTLIYALASLNKCKDVQALHEARASLILILKTMISAPDTSVLVKYGAIWPAVVAGYAAGGPRYGKSNMWDSYNDQTQAKAILHALGRSCGVAMPFYAIRVLEKFWKSGSNDWDECFSTPYAFMV
jgi:hypothetical protein